MAESISVTTSFNASYEIVIGEDLNEPLSAFLRSFESDTIFAIIDENVFGHHYPLMEEILKPIFGSIHYFKVPSGESSKSFSIYQELMNFILGHSPERGTPILAVGGGVTGDIAGFAAATALRGMPLIHMPTTLLAMVDSSIGGKTGINHSEGKNLIGNFYQPKAVFADVRFLKSLPRKEWVNGLSEILKYGMIDSPEIIEKVKENLGESEFNEPETWLPVISKSARIKADIIQEDTLETGKRKFLNFGHTFAHVIEAEGKYKQYSHGEAVFAGMNAAVFASNELGGETDKDLLYQFRHLYDFNLSGINANASALAEKMMKDKKVHKNQLQLILLKETGKPYVHAMDNLSLAEQAWDFVLKEFKK